jgi:hypothetical protein
VLLLDVVVARSRRATPDKWPRAILSVFDTHAASRLDSHFLLGAVA